MIACATKGGRLASVRIQWAAVGVFVVVAVVATLVGTQRGPGTTPDSATYASVAENLVDEGALTTYAGGELTIFPPGVPMLLAAGGLVGMEPATAARVLNAVSYAAVAVFSGVLIFRAVDSVPLRIGGLALVAVSPILLGVFVMMWSEPVFVAVTLAYLLALYRAYDRGGVIAAAVAGLLAGAGFLIRYPGLALAAFGLVALSWRAWSARDRRLIGPIVAFGVPALAPAFAWFVHNAAHGSLLGTTVLSPIEDRARPGRGIVENGWDAIQTIGGWLSPRGGWIVLISIAIIAIVVAVRAPRRAGASGSMVGFVGAFSLAYLAAVLFGASLTFVDPIDDRLLSPVYVPLLVVALAGVEWTWNQLEDRPLLRTGLVVALVLWMALPAVTWLTHLQAASEGVGFADSRWQTSPLVAVASGESDTPLYSNWPDALYLVAGSQPTGFGPGDSPASIAEFAATVRCSGSVRYADFAFPRIGLIPATAFGPDLHLELITTVADGSLYAVTAEADVGAENCAARDR